ncbi:MAG: MBL fold metallo-hydrolase [Acidobacteriaceae bacterium]|nr:MBL fold metallo-hydrolase [Acidobacteriaceae bacterium]
MRASIVVFFVQVALAASVSVAAQAVTENEAPRSATVKITPIGAKTGEYCDRDRALLFEDPTGVRILYDPGVTVAGGTDPRLGDVHAILVSHNHFDHLGYQKLTQNPDDPDSTCGAPQTVRTGNTNTAESAAAKNSAVLVDGNMASFLAVKIANVVGALTPACYGSSIEGPGPNETVIPRSSPCTAALAFGSTRTVTRAAGNPGVRINVVSAEHSDSLFNPPLLFTSPLGDYMQENGLHGYDGFAAGFVLTFTNGLKVYLTGDTGPTADMALIVRDLYHANLAVANMDGVNTMGPEEAAYAMKRLVRVSVVIPSHASQAVTTNGQVDPNTRTAEFIRLLGDTPAYLPLSGRTMEFDRHARCIAGCGN